MKGHIRERSPGHWAVVVEMRDPETGRRKRKWHSFTGNKRQAQLECARLVSEIKLGTYVEPNKMTLAQYFGRWLEDARSRVTAKTHERYTQICCKNIAPLLGAVSLSKLKPEQIAGAYAKALVSGRRKGSGGLSPRTVRQMHAILKSALAQAVRWEILVRNPAAAVRGPKVGRAAMQTYDLEQTAELIEAARGRRVFIPTLLAVLGGLRRGEIAALRWRHVDLSTAHLAVVQSAEQTKAGVRYKEPKSGRGRTIALSATLVTELKAHRVRQAEELLQLGKRPSDDDFVVMQADGSALRPHSLGQEWVRFLERNRALPRIRFHDLRHAHATHLLSSGVHPKVASERLGHSKVGITLDLYSHVLPNMQANAAAIVDDALRAVLKKRGAEGG
jgi:integrase